MEETFNRLANTPVSENGEVDHSAIVRGLIPSGDLRYQLRREDLHESWVHGLVEAFNIGAEQLTCAELVKKELIDTEEKVSKALFRAAATLEFASEKFEENSVSLMGSQTERMQTLTEVAVKFTGGINDFNEDFQKKVGTLVKVLPMMIAKRVNEELAIAEPDRQKTVDEIEIRMLARLDTLFKQLEAKMAETVRHEMQSSEKRLLARLNKPKKRFLIF